MSEEELKEQAEAQKKQQEESNSQDDEQDGEVLTPEEIAELKRKADASSQNFERAKKAEDELKALKSKPEPKKESSQEVVITPKDYLALNEAKISSEDFDEVVRVAKILDKPISEALKDKTLKSIIAERVEERTTAQATQTKSPRGSQTNADEVLLEKAKKGELPKNDADIERLAKAKWAEQIAKTKK